MGIFEQLLYSNKFLSVKKCSWHFENQPQNRLLSTVLPYYILLYIFATFESIVISGKLVSSIQFLHTKTLISFLKRLNEYFAL